MNFQRISKETMNKMLCKYNFEEFCIIEPEKCSFVVDGFKLLEINFDEIEFTNYLDAELKLLSIVVNRIDYDIFKNIETFKKLTLEESLATVVYMVVKNFPRIKEVIK